MIFQRLLCFARSVNADADLEIPRHAGCDRAAPLGFRAHRFELARAANLHLRSDESWDPPIGFPTVG
jgi:hypothetical protein